MEPMYDKQGSALRKSWSRGHFGQMNPDELRVLGL
jgi:hypothetical protein